MTEDEHFYSWLAGFIDGEGCFRIQQRNGTAGFCFSFQLRLRKDDLKILEKIQKKLGIGSISCRIDNGARNPHCVYTINSIDGCLKLVTILDDHPLLAKKSRDLDIFKEALIYAKESKPIKNRIPMPIDNDRRAKINEYKIRLQDVKKYVEE